MLVVCEVCGNRGCFEIVDAVYGETRAFELLECCRCGSIRKVALEG